VRNIGVVIAFALIVLAGLAALVLWGLLGEKPGMRQVFERSEQPGLTAPEKGRQDTTVPEMRRGPETPEGESVRQPEAAGSTPPPQPPVATAVRQPHGFPTAAEIPIGMERFRLVAAFGPPAMRTTSVEQGRQIETFVYLRIEPDAATFILLRDGRVVSASTTGY
jgi:hypothetical protein